MGRRRDRRLPRKGEGERDGGPGRVDARRANKEAFSGDKHGHASVSGLCTYMRPEKQGGSSGAFEFAMDSWGFILKFPSSHYPEF